MTGVPVVLLQSGDVLGRYLPGRDRAVADSIKTGKRYDDYHSDETHHSGETKGRWMILGNTVDDLGQKLEPPVRNCWVLVGRCGKAGLTSY